ncbi:MAG TPA: TolC family protein, partial [Longimicrobiales bacterium]|nr:TolC family protein [Longimicrobiales bacterium]
VARELLAAGVAVRLDVTRAEAQLAGMRARLIAAESDARRARLALLRALDLPLGTEAVLTDSLVVTSGELPEAEEAVAIALEARGDLRAAESDIQVSRRELAAVRAERLPTVDLTVDDGWIGRRPDNLLNTYLWSLEVSVPVFAGFRNRSRREQQRAREESLTLQAEALKEDVAYQVRDALLELSAAGDQVEAARVQLRFSQEEYDQARERFQEGVAGTADVITAGLRLNEARLSRVDALAARELARVSLAAAQGTATGIR